MPRIASHHSTIIRTIAGKISLGNVVAAKIARDFIKVFVVRQRRRPVVALTACLKKGLGEFERSKR
jgi:hypothetical protein